MENQSNRQKKPACLALLLVCLLVLSLFCSCSDLGNADSVSSLASKNPSNTQSSFPSENDETNPLPALSLLIGNTEFTIVLYENETARALLPRLPLTIEMQELNGNEKFYRFSEELPHHATQIAQIHAGDLMLYQADCLVLFYESHQTTYPYTKIGYIENSAALFDAVQSGTITATLSRKAKP